MGLKKHPSVNKEKCKRYKDLNLRSKNKTRKLLQHLKKHPDEMQAKKCLETLTVAPNRFQ